MPDARLADLSLAPSVNATLAGLDTCATLTEIEARQDEVLRQLDELNERLERILAQYGGQPVKEPRLYHPPQSDAA
jgi:hypothetical protein